MGISNILSRVPQGVAGSGATRALTQLADTCRRSGGLPLRVVLPDRSTLEFGTPVQVTLRVRDSAWLRGLPSLTLGAVGDAFVRGQLEVDGDLLEALPVGARLAEATERSAFARVAQAWRPHRRAQDASAIAHHYDVGNEFYGLWLDERMVYSCAYYRQDGDSLAVAQAQKLDHVCRKLRLAPGERLLDIGCGWGALIFWAAEHYGVEATGITLSRNQADHVAAEIRRRGLEGRVHVELRDYLDLPDQPSYEKIASIGMFEHVGVARFPQYFGKIHRLLVPGGFVLNHGITHGMEGAAALGSGIGDFVEDYVFPGGELTHVARVISAMSTAGLEVVDAEALREHYAKTLWHWTDRLEANADLARREAGEARYRVWRVYMAGSAHAFERGWLSLWQLLAGRPFDDGALPHPLTRITS